MTHKRTFLPLLLIVSSLAASTSLAAPTGAIVQLLFQDTGERSIVYAVSDRGVVVIGEDLGPFRAFRSEAISQSDAPRPFVWFEDIDGDRPLELVFGGDPSFALDEGADPYFGILDGCEDFSMGNLFEDQNAEIFCRRRSIITIWNYDGQFIWEYSLTGGRIGACTGSDVDGDEQLEFACEMGSDWILVDLGNDSPVQDVMADPVEFPPGDPFEQFAAEAEAALTGGRTFDLDGDHSADETLLWNGTALTLLDASGATMGSAEIPESELYSVEVGDINSDGSPEVFVGGVDRIYIVSQTGELLAEVEGNPNRLEREPRVSINSASSNGLEDSSSETTRAAVEDGLGAVERCYTREMGSDQFIRVGSIFYELQVNDSGHVSSSQRIHSSVNNEDLDSCVEGALEDLRFSPATASSGTVSVRLSFDFVDR